MTETGLADDVREMESKVRYLDGRLTSVLADMAKLKDSVQEAQSAITRLDGVDVAAKVRTEDTREILAHIIGVCHWYWVHRRGEYNQYGMEWIDRLYQRAKPEPEAGTASSEAEAESAGTEESTDGESSSEQSA